MNILKETEHTRGTYKLSSEGLIRTLKESEHARGTHRLLSTKGGSH
jgi:hypothetical protein